MSSGKLLLNVYMPCNYGDDESMIEYMDCLGDLNAVMVESDAVNTVIAGDFNCNTESKFFPLLDSFLQQNGLIMPDMLKLSHVDTYVSDGGLRCSWIDHILCSQSLFSVVSDVTVLSHVIATDHRQLVFKLLCQLDVVNVDSSVNNAENISLPQWHLCTESAVNQYRSNVDDVLRHIHVPLNLLSPGADVVRLSDLDAFYTDIVNCLTVASRLCLPCRTTRSSQYNVPEWNTFVKEKHEEARQSYLLWLSAGKPRFGALYEDMHKSRAQFKLALRQCQQHIEQMKADACAQSVMDKDAKRFWRDVYKLSNAKATTNVITVGGKVGDSDIAEMWKQHTVQNIMKIQMLSS